MAVIDQDQRYARILRAQQAEQKRDRDERQQLWIFVWILFGFKFVSMAILIFWIKWEQVLYIAVMTSWWWLIVPIVAFSGPILKRLRLRRVRRNLAALRRAEFGEGSARGHGDLAGISLIEDPGSSGDVPGGGEWRANPDGPRQ
jgi:hypothetical protein